MTMKFIILLVTVYALDKAVSELLSRGSFDLSLSQKSPKKKAFVPYMLCLETVPILVKATVNNKNQSLLHAYQARVTEIFIHGFILQMEGTLEDDWHENLIVNWMFYPGFGIIQNRSYIWMHEPRTSRNQTRSQANLLCRNLNATLVDILDKEMYDAVYSYVIATMVRVDRVSVRVWLAQNYNPKNKSMTSSTGQPAYNGDWQPKFPKTDAFRTALAMRVRTGTNQTNIGLRNHPPESALYSRLLCAMPLL